MSPPPAPAPTPVIDRFYFESVYFREPSGVLYELATLDGAGFAADEEAELMGRELALPPFLEASRAQIEPRLTPLPDTSVWRPSPRIRAERAMSPAANLAELGFAHVFEPGEGPWTLLLLHGTGGDEHDLIGLGRQLAPQAALLSPRGRTLENGMPRFFRRLAVGQLDIPDLLRRTDELASFVTAAAATYKMDPGRVIALGLSNGANIAVSLLLRHPGVLRAAALLRPMLPYEPEDDARARPAPTC